MDADIIIVGAGAVGLSCALPLARAGASVLVLDRGEPGAATSWGNCGLIEPSHADPLTQPAGLVTALTSAWRRDAPLRIPFPTRWRRARWLAAFAARCTSPHRRAARLARFQLLVYSRDCLEALIEAEGLACEYRRRGLLTLYRSFSNFAAHRQVHELLAGPELSFRSYVGGLLDRVPVAVSPGVVGAILTEGDGHLNPVCLGAELARVAERRGVTLQRGCTVRRLVTRAGRVAGVDTDAGRLMARKVVLAAGPWSTELARSAGLVLPSEPAKGLSVTWSEPAGDIRHPLYFYERKVVLTPWEKGYRLGSTLEFCGFDDVIPRHRLEPLFRAPGEFLADPPAADRDTGVEWAGFRPMCVDEKPVIGPSASRPGLFYACAHGQLGVSMAVGTGALLGDLLLGRNPIIDPRPFLPARFGI